MPIDVGEKIPELNLSRMTSDGPETISTEQLFKNKKVALFGVPGAFTPTCSMKHLPGFIKHAKDIKSKGIDSIACISVNDVFVMGAWGLDQGSGTHVLMIADGSANFAIATGLETDLTERGMGMRCKRFLMIVDNQIVQSIDIDDPGKFEVTSAEKMLGKL